MTHPILRVAASSCLLFLWSLATIDAQEPPAASPDASATSAVAATDEAGATRPLDELSWMVGDWATEEGEHSVSVACHWTKRGHFLVKRFSVTEAEEVVMEGMQIIGWDPAAQRIRSWTYDSEGGFGEGWWTRDGDRWLVKKTFTLATGEKASAVNVLTKIDDQTATMQSINREVNGDILPNQPEITLQKLVPPEAGSEEATDSGSN